MNVDEFFIPPGDGYYRFAPTSDVGAAVFDDNPSFYRAVVADLLATRRKDQFVYFAGWWSDLRLPLGDPKATPPPPTFGDILRLLSTGLPAAAPALQSAPPTREEGPQVCCMLWQHKFQSEWAAFPGIVLPDSVFGAPILASINTDTVKTVNYLRGSNRGVLDSRHALSGSHHQKFVVMLTDAGLVAYVGSSDFNADRLFAQGDPGAPSAPAKGSPLND